MRTAHLAGRFLLLALLISGCDAWDNSLESLDPAAIAGDYDLVAVITRTDGAFVIPITTTETAILRVDTPDSRGYFEGTFENFWITYPDQSTHQGPPGTIKGTISLQGRVVIELTFGTNQEPNWRGEGELAGGLLRGLFSTGVGDTGGDFTARRRP